MTKKIKTILETPYFVKGDPEATAANVEYARECLRHSLVVMGEEPYASHLLYTQILDDNFPEQRTLGIEAGLSWGALADKTVVYADRGISPGMKLGIERAEKEGRPVEYRLLYATITLIEEPNPQPSTTDEVLEDAKREEFNEFRREWNKALFGSFTGETV